MTMNRRTFLKSLAAVAVTLNIPFPDVETFDDGQFSVLTTDGVTDKFVGLTWRQLSGSYYLFGSRESYSTSGYGTLKLYREYVEQNTLHKVTSYYNEIPTTETLTNVARGNYTGFVEARHSIEML